MDFLNYQVSLIFIETYNHLDTSIRAVIWVDDLKSNRVNYYWCCVLCFGTYADFVQLFLYNDSIWYMVDGRSILQGYMSLYNPWHGVSKIYITLACIGLDNCKQVVNDVLVSDFLLKFMSLCKPSPRFTIYNITAVILLILYLRPPSLEIYNITLYSRKTQDNKAFL